jgi:hypothetical protein
MSQARVRAGKSKPKHAPGAVDPSPKELERGTVRMPGTFPEDPLEVPAGGGRLRGLAYW